MGKLVFDSTSTPLTVGEAGDMVWLIMLDFRSTGVSVHGQSLAEAKG